MKIEKHIIGLVLLILFMGVGYADDNVIATPEDSSSISKVDGNVTKKVAEDTKSDYIDWDDNGESAAEIAEAERIALAKNAKAHEKNAKAHEKLKTAKLVAATQ